MAAVKHAAVRLLRLTIHATQRSRTTDASTAAATAAGAATGAAITTASVSSAAGAATDATSAGVGLLCNTGLHPLDVHEAVAENPGAVQTLRGAALAGVGANRA